MSAAIQLDGNVLGIGPQALHALRTALEQSLGDEAAACLQEIGFAAGEGVYTCFCQWLIERANIDDPAKLDAKSLEEALSEFFQALGWGTVRLERIGDAGLAIDVAAWAEIEPGRAAGNPSCPISAGMLSDFMGRLAGETVAVMEVEAAGGEDRRCRFLAGSPDTLQAVFDAMTAGADYRSALTPSQ